MNVKKMCIWILSSIILNVLILDSGSGQPIDSRGITVEYDIKLSDVQTTGMLFLKNNRSVFEWLKFDSNEVSSKFNKKKGKFKINSRDTTGKFVCKKEHGKEMFSRNRTLSKYYYIKEKIPSIPWDLKQDEKVIGGYEAHKAVGAFRGRSYTVWYTPEIPISNGPWKLGGVPGLILEAKDNVGEVSFQLKKIKKNIPSVKFTKCFAKKGISWEEFRERFNDSIDRFARYMESRMSGEAKVNINGIFNIEKSIIKE
ncbi:GLPGLI family protein [Fodinibius halophilus]|uniref:GLPGLI family protein n=1 Tax=Fodinibius halophilus TaxID=1736908 RepID=A0A6M1T5F2_9BACT|nr:GLPGLI family protein [Fodinibius halophilus]NGP87201.1 GLPGLI family protein [Fodinibius halophilus]